ncbi:unnamed protein product [Acanthoscelides obtectus]|uniref:Uncharacterized protein n=1 Tax=Acanthoscelides obtectus TaxID=200917 RepID=A0A9P0PUN7_ACAOB|nr:unnamed protein product [Acanthoscelides obtectus]CAK1672161.1 hypothetical protein AOBTE_LOCUS28688 [Acanthoscelides obtectus]
MKLILVFLGVTCACGSTLNIPDLSPLAKVKEIVVPINRIPIDEESHILKIPPKQKFPGSTAAALLPALKPTMDINIEEAKINPPSRPEIGALKIISLGKRSYKQNDADVPADKSNEILPETDAEAFQNANCDAFAGETAKNEVSDKKLAEQATNISKKYSLISEDATEDPVGTVTEIITSGKTLLDKFLPEEVINEHVYKSNSDESATELTTESIKETTKNGFSNKAEDYVATIENTRKGETSGESHSVKRVESTSESSTKMEKVVASVERSGMSVATKKSIKDEAIAQIQEAQDDLRFGVTSPRRVTHGRGKWVHIPSGMLFAIGPQHIYVGFAGEELNKEPNHKSVPPIRDSGPRERNGMAFVSEEEKAIQRSGQILMILSLGILAMDLLETAINVIE